MATRIVEWKLPYTWGTGIGIDTNKVISLLLREENNLIHVNDDNEVYTDLQLAVNITPSSDFPVWVTVGKVLQTDWWTQNGLILNRKTTSGDYARWLYWADGELYFDGGQGTWKQVYYSDEVQALFTQLRGELATVAFTGDYNDLINRPAFLQVQADWDQIDTDAPDYIKNKPTIPTVNDATLTIQKNWTAVATFTANSSTATTANITVPNVINNVQSTSTSDALSANQGKLLQDQINDLKAMGRFLSLWDCETGMPISFPLSTPYNYQTWDYFLVENVDTTTNYRPNGVQYTGTASSTVETDEVEVWDLYIYDGSVWLLQINHGKTVSFANLAGQPSDNAALASALNAKADTSSLATVATTGDYGDLLNKPTIPAAQVQSDWNQSTTTAVDYIKNKPTIPSKTSQLNNDSWFITSSYHDSSKQDVLTAGDNININNNTISTEVNTKTFDWAWNTTTAQSVYDWIKTAWHYAIVKGSTTNYLMGNVVFSPTTTTTWTVYSRPCVVVHSPDTSWILYERQITMSMTVSSGSVTSVTTSSSAINTNWVVAQRGSSAPSSPVQWSMWYDTTNNVLEVYDGSAWKWVGGWIQLAPNTELDIKYHWYGSQASYDSLNQYYTDTAWDTAYFTVA